MTAGNHCECSFYIHTEKQNTKSDAAVFVKKRLNDILTALH